MCQKQISNKTNNSYIFITLLLSFLVTASPLLAAESITRSKDSVSRQRNTQPVSSASFEMADFNLAFDHEPDEIVIKFADWTPEVLKQDTLDTIAATKVDSVTGRFERIKLDLENARLPRLPRVEVDGTRVASLESIIKTLDLLPHVDYVEPNYIAKALAIPSDPYYPLQWNFQQIGMPDAWDEAQGEGVVIAVVDSGIAYENRGRFKQAPDLAQTSFVKGYNTIKNNNRAHDDNGHGTHIAGTISGSTNNGEGVASIAYKASLMPVKALNRMGLGGYADIAEGIYWAVDNGADIINLSLGGPVSSNVLFDAIKYARERNVLIVAAAGNNGQGQVLYPAAYTSYVVAVGAVGYDKQKASYSSYGSALDIVAPGGDVTKDRNGDGYPDGILQQTLDQKYGFANTRKFNYYFYQGTSMATPHVVGVAALVKSLGVNGVADIEKILVDSAEDLNSPGWDNQTGYGLLRADKAVKLALQLIQTTNDKQQTTTVDNNNQNDQTGESAPKQETRTPETTPPEEETQTPPEEQIPEPEPEPEEEEAVLRDLVLNALTYNMWGKVDTSYSFWEKIALGIELKDQDNQVLVGASLDIKVYDSRKNLVAKGTGQSNTEGELWLDLGNFSRGSYKVVVEAVKEGFNSVLDEVRFRFR